MPRLTISVIARMKTRATSGPMLLLKRSSSSSERQSSFGWPGWHRTPKLLYSSRCTCMSTQGQGYLKYQVLE
jgi:hypothetical protein